MPETAQEYTQRLTGLVKGRDVLGVIEETPATLGALIAGVDDARLRKAPAPGKWSVQQILAHLVDTDMVMGYRVRRILETDGAELQAFDQNSWAVLGHYDRIPVARSLERIRVQRGAHVDLLRSLQPAQLERYGMHSERGKETVDHIQRMWAGHDLNHRGQIEAILARG